MCVHLLLSSKGFRIGSKLETLEFAPKKVNGDFYCSGNPLSTLKHCPEIVEGEFYCAEIPSLTSLEHGPKYVGGNYIAPECNITNLNGIQEVGGNLEINNNPLDWHAIASAPQSIKVAGDIYYLYDDGSADQPPGLSLEKFKILAYQNSLKTQFQTTDNLQVAMPKSDLVDSQTNASEGPDAQRVFEINVGANIPAAIKYRGN